MNQGVQAIDIYKKKKKNHINLKNISICNDSK